jgi:hypothetical protein
MAAPAPLLSPVALWHLRWPFTSHAEKAGELKVKTRYSIPVAAISCGIVGGAALLDLDYVEDSSAHGGC